MLASARACRRCAAPDDGTPCTTGDPCILSEACSGGTCGGGSTTTTCVGGDGCCPIGCTVGNDSDCGPTPDTDRDTDADTDRDADAHADAHRHRNARNPCLGNATILPAGGGTFTGTTSGGSLLSAAAAAWGPTWRQKTCSSGRPICRARRRSPRAAPRRLRNCSARPEAATCVGAELACNYIYTPCGIGSRVALDVIAGQTYVIIVDGYNGASGNYMLERL